MKKHHHHHHCGHCGHSPHCCNPPHCGHSHCGCRGYDAKESWSDLFWEFYLSAGLFFLSIKNVFAKKKENKKNKLKIAFVGNYSASCGISTYNENLLKELSQEVELRLFAENLKNGEVESDSDWIVRCWDRKEHPKLNLIKKILEWSPNIVHISHEYGIFPYAYQFTSLVSNLRAHGIKVVTTFHSIYEHVDKTVTENSTDHIIVHTKEAAEVLIKKGISKHKIKVIPHGSSTNEGEEKLVDSLWNTWNSNHTIFQPGFLFTYKGHERVLRAVARLKEKYPDIHYIIQGSENQFTQKEHDELYKRLISEAERLGISHNITINRGFVSIDVLMSYIRTVKCCVLPYQTHKEHDVRATSGIARLVLSTTTPLIVSDVHLFDDLKGIVPIVKNDDELTEAIDAIFEGRDEANKQLEKRIDFIKTTSWKNIAKYTKEYYEYIIK